MGSRGVVLGCVGWVVGYDFGGFVDGTGWDRVGSRVRESCFGAWWAMLGQGGVNLRSGGLFWVLAGWFRVCTGMVLGWGVMGFGVWFWGWGGTGRVRRLVGWVLGVGGLCWGMGFRFWGLGVVLGLFWAWAG